MDYVINDLNGEKIIGTFYEKELRKTNQQQCRIEKVIRRKGYRLMKQLFHLTSLFNSWIDQKDLVEFYCYNSIVRV